MKCTAGGRVPSRLQRLPAWPNASAFLVCFCLLQGRRLRYQKESMFHSCCIWGQLPSLCSSQWQVGVPRGSRSGVCGNMASRAATPWPCRESFVSVPMADALCCCYACGDTYAAPLLRCCSVWSLGIDRPGARLLAGVGAQSDHQLCTGIGVLHLGLHVHCDVSSTLTCPASVCRCDAFR